MVHSSEETSPEGETGCVDDRLKVVVGGDQLGRGALAVLRLYGEGLSENHCQRLWEHGERTVVNGRQCGYPNLSGLWGGTFGAQPPTMLTQSPSWPSLTVFPKWESRNTSTKQSVNF